MNTNLADACSLPKSWLTVQAINEVVRWAYGIFGVLVVFDSKQLVTWPFDCSKSIIPALIGVSIVFPFRNRFYLFVTFVPQ